MDSYYKLRQLLCYKVQHDLLQIATSITKCDLYYKLYDSTNQSLLVRWHVNFFLFVESGSGVTVKTKRKCLGSILPSLECYASICV